MDVSVGSIQGIIMLFAASGIGIGGKLIYDYFRLTRMPNNKNGSQIFKNFKLRCDAVHTGIDKSLQVMDDKIERLDVCTVQETLKIQALESDVDEHEKRLEKGIAKFEGIRVDIVEIKTNIAVLLDRSAQRRKTDFTKGVSGES